MFIEKITHCHFYLNFPLELQGSAGFEWSDQERNKFYKPTFERKLAGLLGARNRKSGKVR